MSIFCNMEIMSALKGIKFPKTKSGIISYLEKSSDISEASLISLNRLKNKSYRNIDETCENIKIVCNLEIRDAIKDMPFPASKSDVMDFVRFRNFSDFVIKSLDIIPENYTFKGVSDICK